MNNHDRAREMRKQGRTYREISEALNVPRETVRDWLTKTTNPDQHSGRVIDGLRRQLRRAEDAAVMTSRVREEIFKIAATDPQPPGWVTRVSTVPHQVTPLAILSDIHYSEVTRPGAVNGVNAYNPRIAQERLQRWADLLLTRCFDDRTHRDYPGLVVALGGDMLSGDIHEELAETNEVSTMPAMLELMEVLSSVLRKLQAEFKQVFIPCTFGNHGRNTRKVRFKRRPYSNFDWLLSCLLVKYLGREEGFQFLVPESTDTYFHVQGRAILLNHGDTTGARGGDGFIGALGPIKRGEGKVRRASEKMQMPFQHFLHGHWHSQYVLGAILSNGCVCGYNEYAKDQLRAEPEPPQQILTFLNRPWGVVDYSPLILGDPPRGSDRRTVRSLPGLPHTQAA